MQKVLLIIINLVTLNHLSAQTITVNELINKVDSAYSHVENMSFLIDYQMKFFMDDKTYPKRGIVSMVRQEKDSLKSYFNIYNITENFQMFYNGENILFNKLQDSSIAIIDNGAKDAYHYIIGNIPASMAVLDFFERNYFSTLVNNSSISKIKCEEEEYNGQITYNFSIVFNDEDELSGIKTNYFIDKNTFLVLGYSSSILMADIYEQKIEYTLQNININQYIADTFWTVDYHLLKDYKVESKKPGQKKSAPLLEKGTLAPEIEAKTLDGSSFNLNDYRGKIIFLDFWYQSCYPCLKLMDDLKILADEFPSDKFEIIGVNNIDAKEKMTKFLEQKKIKYTNIYTCKDAIVNYKINAYPTLYIIDKDGKIIKAIAGWSDSLIEELREVLETELK